MTKRTSLIISVILVLIGTLIYFVFSYLGVYPPLTNNKVVNLIRSEPSNEDVKYKIEEVVNGLFVPWSVAFTSETRLLVTERNGSIRVVENGEVNSTPLYTFNDVSTSSEQGLMGLALDPDYSKNKFFYISYAYNSGNTIFVKIVKMIDKEDFAEIVQILLDKIPAASNHAGNKLKFGPDNKLYSSTGDATEKSLAQDKSSLAGKILRIDTDGSAPNDNPFANSYIYSLGHRNPQGLAWFSEGTMVSTEHGPSGFDGPGGGDEINIIRKGQNYGWPEVSHEKSKEGMISPVITFTPAVAPSAVMVYSGKMFPQFKDNVFFGGLRGTGLYRVIIENKDSETPTAKYEKMSEINFGRIREVIESPSGEIYFTTSNRDGRGNTNNGDDKIYKITKK